MSELANRIAALPPEKRLLLELERRRRGAAQRRRVPGGEPLSLVSDADRLLLPADAVDAYPLSEMQAAMLYHMDLTPEYPLYHNVDSYHFEGTFDRDALQRAVQRVVERHPVLRTSIHFERYGEPLQVVHRHAVLRLRMIDLLGMEPAAQQAAVDLYVEGERRRRFDVTRPPLLRFCVHVRSPRTFQFTLTEFHPIFDGWSLQSTFLEILRHYGALCRGEPLPVEPPPRSTFRQFIALERQTLESPAAEEYWSRRLAGAEIMELPRWPRSRRRFRGRHIRSLDTPVDDTVFAGLKELSRSAGVPLKSVFLAVHQVVMGRLAGADDVMTGMISHGRPEGPDGDQVRGLFLNTLPFRLDLSPGGSWRDLARRVFEAEGELFPHRRYPMPALQRKWGSRRLFEVEFNVTNFHVLEGAARAGVDLRTLESRELEENSFPLCVTFTIDPRSTRLRLLTMYHRSELADPQMAAVVDLYLRALEAVAERAGEAYRRLPSVAGARRHLQLVEWNDSAAAYPRHRTAAELVSEVAAERRSEVAVVDVDGGEHTYGALEERANRLARRLAASGVGPGTLVALLARRSVDFLTAVLAVFKAGGVYLPLDPLHPAQRLARVLALSSAGVVLVEDGFAEVLGEAVERAAGEPRPRVLDLGAELAAGGSAEPLPARGGPRHLAYVIFTSGSTGVPKGAMVEQRGMLNHLLAKVRDLELGAADVVAQTASQCFDISVWQFLAPLLVGGRVRVYEDAVTHDPAALLARLEGDGLSVFETVPSMLGAMMDDVEARPAPPALPSLRWMIPTGEALPPDLVRRWFAAYPDVPLLNAYGPTECSDDVSHHAIHRSPPEVAQMPIGRPVVNTRLYVVDRHLRLLPLGVAGELLVGGDGVGRGYLDEPRRTAAVFISDPFGGERGGRLYRTGDLARYLPGGEIEFLGRLDHQVKVRGFRIELGEIETCLRRHPGVGEAVVLAREDLPGDVRLTAYVTPAAGAESSPEAVDLRAFLHRELPEYMVPTAWVSLDELPLTANGKVDRKALPAPAEEDLEERYEPPRTPTEELLARIWSQILGVERVGRDSGFLELGGHSLLATRLVSRVRAEMGVELPLTALFEEPTVAGLARRVDAARRSGEAVPLPAVERLPEERRRGDLPLSSTQERLWVVDRLQPGGPEYNIPLAVEVEGELRPAVLRRCLDELVRRHEVLRSRFPDRDGRPVQVVDPPRPLPQPTVDLAALPPAHGEAEMERLARAEWSVGFDLRRGPLLRSRLLRLGARRWVVLFTVHHIAADGWSMEVLVDEVARLYGAFSAGEPSPLPELPVQYADYAAWQRRRLEDGAWDGELEYWRRRLAGAPEVLDLPADRPRPERPSPAGGSVLVRLPAARRQALEELAHGHGATPFMVLLAVLQGLLYRETGQRDVMVGTDVANRGRSELEGLIGFFINHVVLRADLSGDPTFADLLRQARERSLEAFAHQELPFTRLVSALQPQRVAGRMPLFQVLFVYQPVPLADHALPELRIRPLEFDSGVARFDLTLFAIETADGLDLHWSYRRDLFDDDTAAALAARYRRLLESALESPEARLDDLTLESAAERRRRSAATDERRRAKMASLRRRRRQRGDDGEER